VAQRCGRALTKLNTRAVVGVDTALAQVQTSLKTLKAHHLFAKGKQAKRQGLRRWLTEVGQWVVQTRLLVTGLGERRDRVTQNALTTLKSMHEVAKRLLPQSVQWITTGGVAKGNIVHAGVPAGAGDRAPQGGEGSGVWLAVSAQSPGWGVCLWDSALRGSRRVDGALAGAGGVPRDLWGAGHAGVGGLRPGRLCHGAREGPGQGGCQGHGHPAPRPRGMARGRGRPRAGQERARQDRREHWHPEDRHIGVQQAQGTAGADAGEGRPPVYPLVQSEQVDAGPGTSRQVRRQGIEAGRTEQTATVERQEDSQDVSRYRKIVLRHALNRACRKTQHQ